MGKERKQQGNKHYLTDALHRIFFPIVIFNGWPEDSKVSYRLRFALFYRKDCETV